MTGFLLNPFMSFPKLPVTVEFGTSSGGSATNQDYTIEGKFTLDNDSNISSIGIRTASASQDIKICLGTSGSVGSSDGVIVAQGENTNTIDGWSDVTIDYDASAGDYWICGVMTNTGITYPQFYTASTSDTRFAYNNNTNYKTSNYANAFSISSQGQPLIKANGSLANGFRYTALED
jgi:hypothetical protein